MLDKDKECSELDCVDEVEQELSSRGVQMGVWERWMTRRAAQIVSAARQHEIAAASRFSEMNRRLEAIETALFHPTDGLVNVRAWICLLVKRAAYVAAGTMGFVVSTLAALHYLRVI